MIFPEPVLAAEGFKQLNFPKFNLFSVSNALEKGEPNSFFQAGLKMLTSLNFTSVLSEGTYIASP